MRLKKIDSQKVSAALTVKVILFVEMINTMVSNATYVNHVERLLQIPPTLLHIIARNLLINGFPMLNAW